MAVPGGKSDWDAAKEREPESGRGGWRLGLSDMMAVGDKSRCRVLAALSAVVMLNAPWWRASAPSGAQCLVIHDCISVC